MQFWRAKANKIKDVPFLATVPNDTLDEVVEAVLKKFPDKKLTGFEYVKSPKADEDEAGPSTSSSESSTNAVIPVMVLLACFLSSGLSMDCFLKETAVCPT